MTDRYQAIVIGGSAGGIDALSTILPALPREFPLPVFVVVHLPTDKVSLMASLFAQKCRMEVVEAEDKMPIQPGLIYFAPPDYHMLIELEGRISLSVDAPENYSRPSIDVLFESAAEAYDGRLAGVILTGANTDGAKGLKRICNLGGTGLVQRPERSYASTMPAAALAASPMARAMDLEEITAFLLSLIKQ